MSVMKIYKGLMISCSGAGFESLDKKPYVNLWLTFLGFKKIERVVVDRTLFDAETAEKNALMENL